MADGTVPGSPPATRVVLRPLATPLPLGFLALALTTTVFSAVQLEWIPPTQGRVAALTAIAATVPLQLLASIIGFLTRDPVAGTGMGLLAGTWAVAGFTTLTSPPGATSAGLGVLLLVAGLSMFVPAAAAVKSKVAPAAVMALAGTRFVVTGFYELTGSAGWKAAAGWVGIALAVLALYAALALELKATRESTVLPVGRRGAGRVAMDGNGPLDPADLVREAGVRPQL
jgi:succinate-acetate transporter protein